MRREVNLGGWLGEMAVGICEKLGLVEGLTKSSVLDTQLVNQGAAFLPTPVCLIGRCEGRIQELGTRFEGFYMTVGLEHRGPVRQGGDRELTRLAARERLAELCGSARHVCSVLGPFRPLGSLHPPLRVISGFDLAVGCSKGMEL